MNVHRGIRALCVIAAGLAPVVACLIARFISDLAVDHAIPRSENDELPAITQMWVVGVADGTVPTVLISALFGLLTIGFGLYVIISKRGSPDFSGTALLLICCLAYAVAIVMVGNTLLGTVLAFVPVREH